MIRSAHNPVNAASRQGNQPIHASIIDQFLAEQAELSAVDRFSTRHNNGTAQRHTEPTQARHYRDLMPASPPGPGQQYAFEVDLDACSGCKGCVAACHSLNGLEDDESWRDVGNLVGETPPKQTPQAVQTPQTSGGGFVNQHVTTACHHCVEPGCLQGCPTNAYDKDPITGIVRHLDDQCFGCRYCQFKCPYDVPKYSPSKGIVRKCDMCIDRLEQGQAPACVQACPTKAISIRLVNIDEAVANANQNPLLPAAQAAPDSGYTLPTTIYKTQRDLSQTQAAQATEPKPDHAHPPLIAMLTMTQASVGLFGVAVALDLAQTPNTAILLTALLLGLAGIGASILHLGRPSMAFRAFLGLRTSWLSREAVGFGVWAKIAILYTLSALLLPDLLGGWPRVALGLSTVGFGVACIFASFMLYFDTPRAFWKRWTNAPVFLLTTLTAGLPIALAIASVDTNASINTNASWLVGGFALIALATVLKLTLERRVLSTVNDPHNPLSDSAKLLKGPLSGSMTLRTIAAAAGLATGLLGLLLLPTGLQPLGAVLLVFAAAFCFTGDVFERCLFFQAVVAKGMPKGISR